MSDEIHGHVASVTQTYDGAITVGTAAAGSTILVVDDVADFDETGGWLTVQNPDGTFTAAVAYTGIDDDASTITLAAGLAAAVGDGMALRATDSTGGAAVAWSVSIVDDSDGSTIEAPLTHALITLLGDGIRALVNESVVARRDTDGEWTVDEIIGKTPVQDASYIDPTTLPAPVPILPPASSPALSVQGLTSSFLIKADDVAQTTSIQYHISTVSGFTPDATTLALTTRATLVAINQLPNGTPLAQGTTYYFVAIATNTAGSAAPSAQVSAALTQITNTQISDGAISTPKLQAGSITADLIAGVELRGARTVTGSIQVGNITLDPNDGLTIPLSSGGLIHFPADGSDAVVQAKLHALSATVDDQLSIHGSGNDLAGTLVLDSAPMAPATKPSVSAAGFVNAPGKYLTATVSGSNKMQAGMDATYFYVYSGDVWSINRSTGAVASAYSAASIATLFGGTTPKIMAVVKTSTSYIFLYVSGSNVRAKVANTGVDFVVRATGSYPTTLPWAACLDGSGNLVVVALNTTDIPVVSTFNPSTGAQVGGNVTLPQPEPGAEWPPLGILSGTFDFGAARYVISYGDYTRVYTTAGVEQTANRFGNPSGYGGAVLGWDSATASFWQSNVSASPVQFTKLSAVIVATAHTAKWTQYCDGTRSGSTGPYETKASPVASITVAPRTYLLVIPGSPADGGGANDANKVRVYVDSHLQGTVNGFTSNVYDPPTTTGADSPATEGFLSAPGLTFGTIKSQQADTYGPLFSIDGNGNGGWQAVMPAGTILMWGGAPYVTGGAGNIPAGFLLCDGSAVSRTTYARLFSAIGTIHGAGDGSTTFNVPNLVDRVPVGAGVKTAGTAGGAASVTLSAANLPLHSHTVTGNWVMGVASNTTTGGTANRFTNASDGNTRATDNGGFANNPVNIQNPYRALNFIIKA